jgi:hypothetical protein
VEQVPDGAAKVFGYTGAGFFDPANFVKAALELPKVGEKIAEEKEANIRFKGTVRFVLEAQSFVASESTR